MCKKRTPAHFSDRSYRRVAERPGERSFQVVVEQTDLWVTVQAACRADIERITLQRVNELRGQIRSWMLLEPSFAASLVPLPVPGEAPEIIRRMCLAAAVMGVGPMACVAGGVAAMTAETLLPWSPDCLVENGGDSMLHSTRDRVVGLLAEPQAGIRLGLLLKAGDFPLSLCASSSFIGHSLSFGKGDLVVVRSKDAFMADAAATALCNMLRKPDDLTRVTDRAAELAGEGIDGVFAQCAGRIAIWGNMELAEL